MSRLALFADPAAIGRAAAEALGRRLALSRCFFCDVDPARDVYLIGGMDFDAGGSPSAAGEWPVGAFGPHVGADARAGRVTVVDDTTADPRTAPHHAAVYGPQRVGAYVHLPLRRAGRWVAALLLDRAAPQPWDPAEVALAREVAERAWAAVETARLAAAERAARDRAERLQRVTAAFAQALTSEDVARVVASEGAGAVGAFAAGLGVLDAGGREIALLTAVGVGDDVAAAWRRFPNDPEIPYGAVIAAGVPLFLETRAAFVARFPAMQTWVDRLGTQAAAFLPLVAGTQVDRAAEALGAVEAARDGATSRRVFGTLHFDFDAPRPFAPEDRSLLATLAAQAAQALERVRLVAAERDARAEAEANAQRLQEHAIELEATNEELQALAAELEERTEAAEVAHAAAERARDEAERHREEAERHREEAERANRARADFLASMSHEFRTPLNAIQGYVQLIEQGLYGPVTDAQRQALGRVDRAQAHLLGLVTDVLNFTRLAEGRVAFDVRELAVADLVRDIVPLVAPQLAAKGLALDVALPDLPVHVWADQDKLGQVLLNLLANAVKFTPAVQADGTPGRVRVALIGRGATSAMAYLRVQDSGIGIPRDQQARIFEPFVQIGRALHNPGEGTGLGLAISRDLARGMGGDLRVRSAPGEGATFTVSLRRVVAADGTWVDRRTRRSAGR
ncbi:MAG TPA: GAF domain-containing sensor histidine kinase [Gemmatirosa sp.]|nr:GAF domain-containing sensor histidine kinase [Gemmatirosa sp.]